MTKRAYRWSGLALLVGLVLLGTGLAQASTWTVCAEGCDYSSIQEAIDAASPGDAIKVKARTYKENLEITKSVTLIGQEAEETIIESAEEGYSVIQIKGDEPIEVKIEGLTVTGAFGNCADSSKNICPNGLLIRGQAKVVIFNSQVSGNYHDGLYVEDSAQVVVRDRSSRGMGKTASSWRTRPRCR